MKKLSDIVTACKDGEHPEYDDLRLAVCALHDLMSFDLRALMNLAKGEKEGKKKFLMYSAEFQYKESFNRRKNAMQKTPIEWLGPNHDPDSDEVQQFRKSSSKLLDKILTHINESKQSMDTSE